MHGFHECGIQAGDFTSVADDVVEALRVRADKVASTMSKGARPLLPLTKKRVIHECK